MAFDWLRRLAEPLPDRDAQQLRSGAMGVGATPVSACMVGQPVTVSGVLRSVTLRPRAGVPALEAELFDGSGHLTVVWLGRRRIQGIEPGRSIRIEGRLTQVSGNHTIFNPRYTLRASAGA